MGHVTPPQEEVERAMPISKHARHSARVRQLLAAGRVSLAISCMIFVLCKLLSLINLVPKLDRVLSRSCFPSHLASCDWAFVMK